MKIDQSAFIQDLIQEKNLSNCNSTSISIKNNSFIDIKEENNYEKANLKIYQ